MLKLGRREKGHFMTLIEIGMDLIRVNRLPFSLSIQPLTAFAILSYGKRDFAEAEGRKTEIGERCTRRRRGGGWGKKNSHWTRTA